VNGAVVAFTDDLAFGESVARFGFQQLRDVGAVQGKPARMTSLQGWSAQPH
jgi:hypothetical protein